MSKGRTDDSEKASQHSQVKQPSQVDNFENLYHETPGRLRDYTNLKWRVFMEEKECRSNFGQQRSMF